MAQMSETILLVTALVVFYLLLKKSNRFED